MLGMSLEARRRLLRTVVLLTVVSGVYVFTPVWNQFHTRAGKGSLRRSPSLTRYPHEEMFTHAGASLPVLANRSADSDAFWNDWSCLYVNNRTVLFSHNAPGKKNTNRCKLWPSDTRNDCTKPDVLVLTPGELASASKGTGVAARLREYLTVGESGSPPLLIAVDCSQDYGHQYIDGIDHEVDAFSRLLPLSARGLHSIVVGAGALGEPHRREFNAYWLMTCNWKPFQPQFDPPKDRILCLGGTPRAHKVYMLSVLHARGVLNRVAWSAGAPTLDRVPFLLARSKHHGVTSENVAAYLRELPRIIDINVGVSKQQGGVFHSDLYAKGSIHVVLETDYLPGRLRYTEKTIKAIYAGKPFIVLSSPGTLALLKSHGFRTFHPHFNETYDTIQSFGDRSKAIADEVERLLDLPEGEFAATMRAIAEVAKHNEAWLRSLEFRAAVLQQSLYAFGLDPTPGFDWKLLNATLMGYIA